MRLLWKLWLAKPRKNSVYSTRWARPRLRAGIQRTLTKGSRFELQPGIARSLVASLDRARRDAVADDWDITRAVDASVAALKASE